ncbi:MAG: YtxH domain-containing protein [Cyclobacteriaceae bacterium]|nr:YtxH domain-containing protein [Cyclobacteriaceae bacterium]MCB9239337.1 YtxH domain-containing protein [Flammeovirgaceae bacterium]MCB0500061.1 YtxH domain-containing protein [Cyclobacteriaceae bacterium]MCO5271350.1 YtxH domain-containing protein [Cyclobacteriaceae bacterium]MCW5903673.1 YtxH domain-containing protein [Cyclobacteriaceae bacterium]
MNTKTKVLGGFLIGAALGAATGLMLAPRSGKKTRKKLKAGSQRLANELIEKANESLDSMKEAYNKKIEEYTRNGKSRIDHFTESIKV